MAVTTYGVNNPVAVKLWSRKLFSEALKATWGYKFMGKSSDSMIQILDDTQKGPGDQITVPLRMQLTGDGVVGDGTLEGNEEALSVYTDSILINQLRHAVRSAGKMSEQRIPFSVRDEAKSGLRDWWADRIDRWMFNQLAGNTAVNDVRYTGLNACAAPDANHRVFAGAAATDEGQGAGDVFNLTVIDKAVNRAKTLDQSTAVGLVPIRPIMVNGEEKYVLFLHPNQVYSLRTSTASGQWLDIQKAAMQGGNVAKNPIYTGALGEYNGVVLHESYRVPNGVNSTSGAAVANARRAILAGAQAGVLAFGQDNGPNKMDWVEELFDYKNQLGVSAGMTAGLKKTRFNNLDFGTLTISTYAAQPV